MQTLNDEEEKEKCQKRMGLCEVLSYKFKLHHNKTPLSLHYCKLKSKQVKNAEEWVGYLRLKANKSWYKEKDRG